MRRLSIIGAGWAGMAAAVQATQAGWQVELFEASTRPGGRARDLPQSFANQPLDNGQHVLIGAYRSTMALMRTIGLNPDSLLQRIPLDLRFADGQGLHLPNLPAPFNLLLGIARTQNWTMQDRVRLVQAAWQWQRAKFECNPTWTVHVLCQASNISPRVMTQLIEPLCLSALNTRVHEASASVFLRVLHDALFDGPGSSDLLLPRVHLGALLPDACTQWLQSRGAVLHLGQRVSAQGLDDLRRSSDAVVLACPAWEAARLSAEIAPPWAYQCAELAHTAIATVYMHCKDVGFKGLGRPIIGLHSDAKAPAQFVFDKGILNSQDGLLAAVVSACHMERDELTELVHDQVCEQLVLSDVEVIQTIVEKRATLACTPLSDRPDSWVSPGVWACGDYIRGPYPSTLEGAVRSGLQVITQLR